MSKPVDCTAPRVKLRNSELQMIMMVSVGALIIASVTSLVWGTERGGGYSCVGAGSIWEIFVSSFRFCCESKTALKTHGL